MYMETTLVAAHQIAIMFLLMGLGVFLTKIKFFNETFNQRLSQFLLNVVVPCLLVSSFQIAYSPEMGRKLFLALLLAVATQWLSILIGKLLFWNADTDQQRIAKLGVAYGNCGFMGLPLLNAVLGVEGVFYASAYIMIFNMATWTHGYAILKREKLFSAGQAWYKPLLLPPIIAAALGILLFYCPFRLPQLLQTSLQYVANMNTPLAMLVLGGFLVKINFKQVFSSAQNLLSYAGKLLIVPLVALLFVAFLPIDHTAKIATAIICAMPSATGLGLQAVACDSDGYYASQLVAACTLLSALSIPLVIFLAEKALLWLG